MSCVQVFTMYLSFEVVCRHSWMHQRPGIQVQRWGAVLRGQLLAEGESIGSVLADVEYT